MSRRAVLSCLCILVGYLIFGLYALSLRIPFNFPVEVYWLSFVFVSIPLFYETIFWRENSKLRIFYLLSFSLMLSLQYAVVDFSPLLTGSDAVADYRLTDKIISESHWSPSEQVAWFFGPNYRFYPVTNFIYATFSMLTGIPLILAVKYLFIIKALIIPLLIQKFLGNFFNKHLSFLATVFFLSSPGAILFPHKESFAIIFFVLGLYATSRVLKNRQYLSIALISILTLVMTHHFTTYIFLGILTSLYVWDHIFKDRKSAIVSTQVFLLSWVVFITWITFISWTIFSQHQKLLFSLFFESVLPGELSLTGLLSETALYERIIVSIGYGVTLFSAGLGFLEYLKNRKKSSSGFMAIMLFLLPLLAVATIFRFTGYADSILISHRAFEFGYILIGACSALFFVRIISYVRASKKLALNLVLISSLVLMMIVGPMAGSINPKGELYRLGKVISFNSLSTNTWMNESGASLEYTVSDRAGQLILTGYGDCMTIRYPELFTDQNFTLPEDASYVATYIYMTEFYGTNLKNFYNSPYLCNVYSNGVINIYKIRNQSSNTHLYID